MRNLLEYPVTREEIIELLLQLSQQFSEEFSCGDMRPLLLQIAAKAVKEADDESLNLF